MVLEKLGRYFERPGCRGYGQDWKDIANIGFAAAVEGLEKAYEGDGDGSDAVRYLKDLAVPAFREYRGLPRERDPDLSLVDEIDERYEDLGEPDFNKSIDSDVIGEMAENVKQDYGDYWPPGRFDYAVGVADSGIPFLYAVTPFLDTEEVVLKYSVESEDDKVKIIDEMRERDDFKGSSIILIDDGIITGETMEKVGEYLFNMGAAEILARQSTGENELELFEEDGEVEIQRKDQDNFGGI